MFLSKIANLYDGNKRKTWEIANLSGLRSDLYYFYLPQMDLIRTLRKNKEYSRLSLVLSKNDEAVKKGLESGIGFAINRELYEIQLEVYTAMDKTQLVEKLKNITPESYMVSIVKD